MSSTHRGSFGPGFVLAALACADDGHPRARAGTRQSGRRVALPERRLLGDALLPGRPDRRRQLRRSGSGLGVAGRQLRARGRPADEVNPDLHRRHPVHGGGTAPHRGRHRSRDRRDHLDLPRAQHDALGAVDAPELRQGRGVRRNRWPGRHLLHLSGIFPARAGREDRPAPRGIRRPGADRGLPRYRCRRSAGPAARRLGTVGGLRGRVRSRLRQSRASSASSPPPRRPSSSTTPWWWATRPSRGTTRPASKTCPATSSPSTRAPETTSGSST